MAELASRAEQHARPGNRLLRTLRMEWVDPERRTGYLLTVPVVLVIAAIAVYPLANGFWLSLTDTRPNGVTLGFVGIQNYVQMFRDPDFHSALLNTSVFTVISVCLEFVLGMGIALALNREFGGRGAARAVALVPWAYPTVVSATMWRLMFSDQVGIVNYLGHQLHLISAPILSNSHELLAAAILVDIWKTTPFTALLILAGLQVIPSDIYEAAGIDGARPIRQFLRLTLPLVSPALMVAMIFRTLDAWRVYDLFWVMSDRQLESISTYVYKAVRISQLNFSLGNAASVFVFVTSLLIAVGFVRLLGSRSQ